MAVMFRFLLRQACEHHATCSQVDAFAAGPSSGNPAVVVLLHDKDVREERHEVFTEILQATAAGFKQPATCFVGVKRTNFKANHFSLRWFSPTHELPLCGHGTMASTAALIAGTWFTSASARLGCALQQVIATTHHAAEGVLQSTFLFSTQKGVLTVERFSSDADSPSIIQIALPRSHSSTQLPKGLSFDRDQLKVIWMLFYMLQEAIHTRFFVGTISATNADTSLVGILSLQSVSEK